MASLMGPDGETHELSGGLVTIGRDPANSLVIGQDPKVSRSHAEVRLRDGQWLLVDLDSRNGTMVNDRRASEHPLRDSDRIRFGGTTYVYEGGADENATEFDTSAVAISGPALSERECQVLVLVAQGLTDAAIGEQLSISVSTVRSHLDRIKDKTGLRRRSELTRLALELHIVD